MSGVQGCAVVRHLPGCRSPQARAQGYFAPGQALQAAQPIGLFTFPDRQPVAISSSLLLIIALPVHRPGKGIECFVQQHRHLPAGYSISRLPGTQVQALPKRFGS